MKEINRYEAWYVGQIRKIINEGTFRGDRTGTGVWTLPFQNYTHDLRRNYPILSTRLFKFDQPITEIIWMLSGSDNIQFLKDNGCPFWNGFAVKGDKIEQQHIDLARRVHLLCEKTGRSYNEVMLEAAQMDRDTLVKILDIEQIPNVVDVVKAKDGDLGPVYGVQWRHWLKPDGTTFDQIQYALDTLKDDPNSRRVVVNCWNPSYLPDPKISPAENAENGNMALTPCHYSFGFYTQEIELHERAALLKPLCSHEEWKTIYPLRKADGGHDRLTVLCDQYGVAKHYIDINFVMRSNDWILGQPANMNMYSAMLMMFGKQLNMIPRFVNYTGWDTHIYANHIDGVQEILKRWDTGKFIHSNAKVTLRDSDKGLFDYRTEDFTITDYYPAERIKFPIAI